MKSDNALVNAEEISVQAECWGRPEIQIREAFSDVVIARADPYGGVMLRGDILTLKRGKIRIGV